MLMPTGMHMHPMLRIRFERRAPISAPAARVWIGAKRTEADIGAGRNGAVMDTKKAGRAAPPGDRFLALYFTWRQEAANHHDIDCARQSRAHPGPRQGPPASTLQLSLRRAIAPPYMVCSICDPAHLLKGRSSCVRRPLFSASVTRCCASKKAGPVSSRTASAANTFCPSPSVSVPLDGPFHTSPTQ